VLAVYGRAVQAGAWGGFGVPKAKLGESQ
jgi:hypothetical protein